MKVAFVCDTGTGLSPAQLETINVDEYMQK